MRRRPRKAKTTPKAKAKPAPVAAARQSDAPAQQLLDAGFKPLEPIKPKRLSKKEKAALAQAAQKARREAARALAALAPAAAPPPLTCSDDELRFVIEYLKDLNGSAAIIRAGIHDDPLQAKVYASRYLDRPQVILELARRRGDLIAKQELSLERVNEELRRIGYANLSDVAEWDGDTLWLHPQAVLSEEQLSAIAEIEEIPGLYGTRLAIKMHDKKGALVALQKHLSPSPAENRFNGGAAGGGSATIILEGGPTGLEVTVSVKQAGITLGGSDD